MSAGIDYGRGQTNIDLETGIRFGVISQHSVTQAWCDSSEPDYGPATCPKCGNEAKEHDGDTAEGFVCYRKHGCDDFMCVNCEMTFDSDQAYGDEPACWSYQDDGYELVDCLDSDIMILKSPYYTFAQFCSPCVPGACSIERPDDDGARAYCLGHNWFESGKAPYPVYSVETNEPINS